MSSLARAERAALLDLMADLGPDADTLCEGWATVDMARHLLVRERQPLAIPGYALPALAGLSARFEAARKDEPYEDLLAGLRRGAPFWSPVGPPTDRAYDLANVHEFFVHHEDVRRAQGEGPRALDRDLEQALWTRLRLLGPVFTRRAGIGVRVVTPGAQEALLHGGSEVLTVRGRVGELFLWLFGRDVAEVELDGDASRLGRVGP